MKYDNDVLTVTFCRDDDGESGIAVFKELENDGGNVNVCMIKMETGEQAEILYRLLTDQSEKAAKKVKKSKTEPLDKYHTCGRCKYEQLPEDVYPCDRCMYGPDDRYDFWEAKKDE